MAKIMLRNLVATACSISFPGTRNKEIGRQLCLSVLLSFLNAAETLAFFHEGGTKFRAALLV